MSTTNLLSLSEIFNQSIFRIPDYQRGYSWGKHQIQDFLDDLYCLENGKVHYTGLLTIQQISTVELQKHTIWEHDKWLWGKRSYKVYYVVDGQQRLTTASILIFCLLKLYQGDSLLFFKKEDLIKKYVWEMNGDFPSFLFGYERDNPSEEYYRSNILEHAVILSQNNPEHTVYTSNLKIAKEYFLNSLNRPRTTRHLSA